MLRRFVLLPLTLLAATSACGSADDGAVDVALIGSEDAILTSSLRLSGPAQHIRAATQSGLVSLNAQGEVVPALAEAWIVVDEGQTFIFRLRQGSTWPDGTEMTAASVEQALEESIDGLDGTSLAQDLALVEEVRAMAGRVIEIRLSAPVPYLVQLLAQPELALRQPGGETGPMTLARGEEGIALDFKPPLERGLPEDEDWREDVRELRVHFGSPAEAIAMFDAGEAEVVLGGTLGSIMQVDPGPLSAGTLRVETPYGLFGLHILAQYGLLSNSGVREGIAMAIDREALLADFNVGGWTVTTRPVSPDLPSDPGLVNERWQDEEIADLRAEAAARIAEWRRQFDEGDLSRPATITVAMPAGSGWEALFNDLAAQLIGIDILLLRVEDARSADMVMIDRVARYASPLWFLNQFHCGLGRGLCAEEVDAMVEQAIAQRDPAQRARMLAQAEAALTLENVYIPIASPLRWSLVRGSVEGFTANAYAFHPLPDLALIPR
ncbi:ABC transporter substrate-binding protein [Aurantiacibacter gangjinensis]|uniref:Solute-binding protein family 5 domain-containing protein n=1 Tax=Aurantiacibacter gangjinensis TaxID=502682 RepID=A0A0G9MSD4_9SPHN|nr:ABC transporter substrate-binding protein [Aurantiacibacter gangjinensis]KLE32233.1 hypothetical protein AAW01_09265 [Aurantiacibacter gangjinensis]